MEMGGGEDGRGESWEGVVCGSLVDVRGVSCDEVIGESCEDGRGSDCEGVSCEG